MLKKILYSVLFISSLSYASSLQLNLMDSFQNNSNWDISMQDGGTYYVMLPMDINYSVLQNSITDNDNNGTIWIYRWYQKPELLQADFGSGAIFGVVKITKNSIQYYYNDGNWGEEMNFNNFSNYLKTYSPNDANKESIYKNSYVASFDKIHKNKLYLIMPKNMNFDLSIVLPVQNLCQCPGGGIYPGGGSTSPSTGVITPPNPVSSIGSSNVETPPEVPQVSSGTQSDTSGESL